MNLYSLTTAQHAMQAHLEAAGFDDQTIADTLDGEENTDALHDKRLGYVAIIQAKRAMAEARKAASIAIIALMQRDEEAADRLEAALFASMQATGDMDLIGLEFEAHIKGKPVAVVISDASKVPALYMRTPETTPPKAEPDKAAIKKALLAGKMVDGCTLGTDKKLVIL